jgi:SAM-dependent methyltransferase
MAQEPEVDLSSAHFAAVFDQAFTRWTNSQTSQRVFHQVFGDEYPDAVEPYSYTTTSELRRIGQELRLTPSHTFVDVGCGEGGPGLWVARASGATLLGIDVSPVAVAHAQQRALGWGLAERARFQVGDFLATGLAAASVDGAMSVDALHFAPAKAAAIGEVARILRPGARFVLTTWDFTRTPPGRPPQVADHRPLFAEVGFAVEAYDETPDWERRQRAVHEGIIAARKELVEEFGDEGDAEIAQAQVRQLEMLPCARRRILIVARKG